MVSTIHVFSKTLTSLSLTDKTATKTGSDTNVAVWVCFFLFCFLAWKDDLTKSKQPISSYHWKLSLIFAPKFGFNTLLMCPAVLGQTATFTVMMKTEHKTQSRPGWFQLTYSHKWSTRSLRGGEVAGTHLPVCEQKTYPIHKQIPAIWYNIYKNILSTSKHADCTASLSLLTFCSVTPRSSIPHVQYVNSGN